MLLILTWLYESGGSNEVSRYEEIAAYKKDCGVSSVMLARSAMWNCSVFRKEGLIEIDVIIKRYLEIVSWLN